MPKAFNLPWLSQDIKSEMKKHKNYLRTGVLIDYLETLLMLYWTQLMITRIIVLTHSQKI